MATTAALQTLDAIGNALIGSLDEEQSAKLVAWSRSVCPANPAEGVAHFAASSLAQLPDAAADMYAMFERCLPRDKVLSNPLGSVISAIYNFY